MEDRTQPLAIRLQDSIEVFFASGFKGHWGKNLDNSLVGSISILIGSFPISFYVSKMFNPHSAQYIVDIFI